MKICHNGNTISVSVNAVSAHLNHGCKLGDCSEYSQNKFSDPDDNEEEHDHEGEESHSIENIVVKVMIFP